MLERLAVDNEKWQRIAYNICGCRDTAAEIVQEMYIKLHGLNREINAAYVTLTMRSIFIDMTKKTSIKNRFIPVDEIEQYDKPEMEGDNDQINELEIAYEIVKSVFNSLPWHKRTIIQQSYIDGVRKFSRESNIYVDYITRTRKELKLKIWQELKRKKSQQELEMLLHKSLQALESSPANRAKSADIFLM